MHASFHLTARLEALLLAAGRAAGLETGPGGFLPEVRTADPRHGDFQANGVLGYAKARKLNPRAVAQQLVAALPPEAAADHDVAIAGPGFINFTVRPSALLGWLLAHGSREALAAGAAAARGGQTWVVDYGGNNTAKQMHVGHLRSAVIGEALCRLLEFSGSRVIRDNHLGDWGTQFGKLIFAYKRWADPAALAAEPIEELERLYRRGNEAAADGSPELDEARRELVRLQQGDPASLELWQTFTDISLRAFQQIYERLGIRFDHNLGESFYNDQVGRVYRELTDSGLAAESDGALVVFHPEHPRFKTQPFIIRKSDGAANYASTDLATILYRAEHFHATGILYVVDKRQGDHFEQLFLTVGKWAERTGRTLPQLEHVDFGTVVGEDGRPLKTRSGDNVRLKDLLDEAEERAFALVTEKNPGLPEADRRAIAKVVGVGSVQYADLAQNRSSDYVFSWEKMISLEGNTAAYLLYAVARLHSIFARLPGRPAALASEPVAGHPGPGAPETPAELALARKLVKFPDAIALATSQLRPHFLSLYLYELAGEFSAFYAADKVIVDDAAVRERRLLLCDRTLLILDTGLNLLGLRTLTRM